MVAMAVTKGYFLNGTGGSINTYLDDPEYLVFEAWWEHYDGKKTSFHY
jgi:hypothetical protein